MELIPQTPEMVKKDWDFFVEAIEATATKVKEDYTPIGVYLAVKDYQVTVFHVYQDGERRGLLVLTDHTDLYTSKTVLHVDILYLTGPSLIHEMTIILNTMVEEHGFDQIEFRSPRKGWFKYLSNAGFKACAIFSKEF